ncbi:DUF3124 domain-containing protein [Salinibacter ruber]|uniref:DUF3124 domain-containing protein n=1 Tax=Salinibacter ruber TaxID=146919 RepID=UPI00311A9EEF
MTASVRPPRASLKRSFAPAGALEEFPGRQEVLLMRFPSPPRRLTLPLALVLVGALCACGPSDRDANTEPPASHLDSLPTASSSPDNRGAPTKRVRSQTLYVPAYSHIYPRDAQRSMNLATTLSIRNTSRDVPLTLSSIDYYDSCGRHVRAHLDTARTLGPLASTYVVVDVDDIRGGVGANFILQWRAERPVPPPVVETVMITGANRASRFGPPPACCMKTGRLRPGRLHLGPLLPRSLRRRTLSPHKSRAGRSGPTSPLSPLPLSPLTVSRKSRQVHARNRHKTPISDRCSYPACPCAGRTRCCRWPDWL